MKVTVTQKHIDRATKLVESELRSKSCPVALAVKDLFPKCEVSVSRQVISVFGEGKVDYYEVPPIAFDLIMAFDLDKPVRPTKFSIVLI